MDVGGDFSKGYTLDRRLKWIFYGGEKNPLNSFYTGETQSIVPTNQPILNVNIINFEKVDRLQGGGGGLDTFFWPLEEI